MNSPFTSITSAYGHSKASNKLEYNAYKYSAILYYAVARSVIE